MNRLNGWYWQLPVLVLCLWVFGVGAASADSVSAVRENAQFAIDAPASKVWQHWALQFAAEIPATPRRYIQQHLQTLGFSVSELNDDTQHLPDADVVWLIGRTPLQMQLPQQVEVKPAEGFALATLHQDSQIIYSSLGNDGDQYDLTPQGPAIGDLYAAYALLEALGMRFLHPLQPSVSSVTVLPTLNIQEQAHWPIRTWHIHTQHPLELTHVLNGWGPLGPDDEAGWNALLPEWERFLEWAVANKQNRVEWFLLMADSWQVFADSPERQQRLQKLVQMAHEWGLAVGIDAPIAFRQQHAWTMVRQAGNETAQIHQAIDWLVAAGFDYLEIEMGFSEFTHPSDWQMLNWMNAATDYAHSQYGKKIYVKVHCAQNQTAQNFVDPETGAALNFNFLPYYADGNLGVLPHTVQYYDLQGPVYTYGNSDFHELRRYMQMEAGRREVLYYPETAYWVNFDIDVPLFLPVYAASRLQDLRLIARDELAGRMGRGEFAGSRIQGQTNFSSGWEWGYWLNDVVTARAAWNPLLDVNDREALRVALQPFTSMLGDANDEANAILRAWIEANRNFFWYGAVTGASPQDAHLRNAQAYLQGWDTWSDLGQYLGKMETQPAKMGLQDMTNLLLPPRNRIPYGDLAKLLRETSDSLNHLHARYRQLERKIPVTARPLFDEIGDAMEITVLRAEQVLSLYQAVANQSVLVLGNDKRAANLHLNLARHALDSAAAVVQRREQFYRVDPARIAGWQYNPTAYHFGYLWTVHSLYFWWRDEGRAVDRPASPGYLNIKDPVDIANGEGEWLTPFGNLSWIRQRLALLTKTGSAWQELLFEPSIEPVFPPPGLRERPAWYSDLIH